MVFRLDYILPSRDGKTLGQVASTGAQTSLKHTYTDITGRDGAIPDCGATVIHRRDAYTTVAAAVASHALVEHT